MSHVVDAIYEDGVLKLEHSLPLNEREKVWVTVERIPDGKRHSVLDIPPVNLGKVLHPLAGEDDILEEMLEDRR